MAGQTYIETDMQTTAAKHITTVGDNDQEEIPLSLITPNRAYNVKLNQDDTAVLHY